jgi:uncharacterized protein (DUF58 family)
MNNLPISEEFLQQIEVLQTLIKNNVAGMFGGNHQSKRYGSSCEFSDYRDYMAGDDIKKIDWNAYARFEKLYLKLYLDERQLHTKIYIDCSRSMSYGNSKKDVQSLRLAAALAYLAVCEMDKVSIFAVKGEEVQEVISGMLGKDAYINNISKLNSIVFEGDSKLSRAILPTDVGYGDGLSVIISDFLTDENFEDCIDLLASKRRDILCAQVLSKEELTPKLRGKVHLFDSENNLLTYRKNVNREIINAYKQALEYATGRVRDFCSSRGADYMLISAEETMQEIFFGKLTEMGVIK